jgi:hypothetical protein
MKTVERTCAAAGPSTSEVEPGDYEGDGGEVRSWLFTAAGVATLC